jgi:hypothetical protein
MKSVTRNSRIALRAVFCLLLVSCLSAVVKADTTYTYDGAAFDQFFGVTCPPICHITGSFTLANPIAPNTDYRFSTVSNISDPAPLAFSFDAGFGAITLAKHTDSGIHVITDANGDFSRWAVTLNQFLSVPGCVSTVGFSYNSLEAANLGLVNCFDADNNLLSEELGQSVISATTTPMVWTTTSSNPTSTPEPGGIALTLSGLLVIAGYVTIRRHALIGISENLKAA